MVRVTTGYEIDPVSGKHKQKRKYLATQPHGPKECRCLPPTT